MTKYEYLGELEKRLEALPHKDVCDIMNEIRNHFEEGIASGKSEEEICESLGDVGELADSYKDGATLPQIISRREKANRPKNSGPDTQGIFFVILFNLFVGLPAWLSVLGILLGLAFVLLILVSLIVFFISSVFMGSAVGFVASIVLLCITLMLLSVLIFSLVVLGFKYFAKGTAAYIKWNRKVWFEGLEG